MNILADEGFNGNFVKDLRKNGFVVEWISEIMPGISDFEVIEYAKTNNQILLTEDKDFGEWVFAHKVKGLTIIFIRYKLDEVSGIVRNLLPILEELKSRTYQEFEFITITMNKIRRRKI